MTKHGKPHGHAFLNFLNRERYRETQGADAWQKMLAFLDRHLARRSSVSV